MRDSLPSYLPEELICEHESAGGPKVSQVRGTVLVSSLQVLREAGHFERYLEQLPAVLHDQLLYLIALSWVPVEVAIAHYAACDALALPDRQLEELGELVATRLADTFLGTVLQTSRSAGIDAPWLALRSQPRIWDRVYVGGGVRIWRVGMKDAVGEFYGLPLAQFHYFRVAFCAYYRGLANMFARGAHVKPVRAKEPKPDTLAIMGSWV